MSEKPIIFSAPMVRALLDGLKTQTRRVVKQSPIAAGPNWSIWWSDKLEAQTNEKGFAKLHAPYAVGDVLWVRERLTCPDEGPWFYHADNQPVMVDAIYETSMLVWAHHKQRDYCPSIHMPRWASRISLDVTAVRCECLQDITDADAIAEGIGPFANSQTIDCDTESPRRVFSGIWDSINGKKHPWESNPWVWAISFRRRP